MNGLQPKVWNKYPLLDLTEACCCQSKLWHNLATNLWFTLFFLPTEETPLREGAWTTVVAAATVVLGLMVTALVSVALFKNLKRTKAVMGK